MHVFRRIGMHESGRQAGTVVGRCVLLLYGGGEHFGV